MPATRALCLPPLSSRHLTRLRRLPLVGPRLHSLICRALLALHDRRFVERTIALTESGHLDWTSGVSAGAPCARFAGRHGTHEVVLYSVSGGYLLHASTQYLLTAPQTQRLEQALTAAHARAA